MSADLETIPPDRLQQLACWLNIHSTTPPEAVRERVVSLLSDKEVRMTPWGLQFLRPQGNVFFHRKIEEWLPPMPYEGHAVICGRWIRDIEVPVTYAGHPPNCICSGRPPPELNFSDVTGWTSGLLHAFRNEEVSDPTLDLAEPHATSGVMPSKTRRCLITDLPPEVLDLILAYLIPGDGQTYHFFQTRAQHRIVQIVQKIIPDPSPFTSPDVDGSDVQPRYCGSTLQGLNLPATGSVGGMALSATCKAFQDLTYRRFYGKNSFIFHHAPPPVHVQIRSSNFENFRCWSKITQRWSTPLGPLTSRAASYMKDVTLLVSLITSTWRDVDTASRLVSDTACKLANAKLDYLSVSLNTTGAGRLYERIPLPALWVNCLQADVESGGKLRVRVRDALIEPIQAPNRAENALLPLLQGPNGVKELVLRGPLSDGFVEKLKDYLQQDSTAEQPVQAKDSTSHTRQIER